MLLICDCRQKCLVNCFTRRQVRFQKKWYSFSNNFKPRCFFSLLLCNSVQCVSKCARPICSSAPQTACQASGRSAFISGGAAFRSITPNRWIKSTGQEHRREKTQGGNLMRCRTRCDLPRKVARLLLIFVYRICCAVR